MPDAQQAQPKQAGQESTADPTVTVSGVVLLLLAKIKPAYWTWGWNRIAFGRWTTGLVPGLQFSKVMGSGQNGGFGLVPSPSHQGMFCIFDNEDSARDFVQNSSLTALYRERSAELFTAMLRVGSSRGSWDGVALEADVNLPEKGPIATLTRASIRPAAATAFWRRAPATQDSLHLAEGCKLAVGLGEAPLLRQATFSLWQDTEAMNNYARTGAHMDAIKAAHEHRFFSESMFVRFVPVEFSGSWQGRSFG
jgi:spheroidene monooxygenase